MRLRPCTVKEAARFTAQHHRHSKPPVGGLFAVGVEHDGELVGVGIAGRPVARVIDSLSCIEITRCCTDGTPNAASMIYGALTRAAKALGYKWAITYTLETEPGASLRASNWTKNGLTADQSWNRPSRPRHDVDLFGERITPSGRKRRWSRRLA